jgi:hypothetical protein
MIVIAVQREEIRRRTRKKRIRNIPIKQGEREEQLKILNLSFWKF